jgi:hypothetical protein
MSPTFRNGSRLLGVWAALVLSAGTAWAQTGGTGLKGDYYNGNNFETFVLSRTDGTVNFSWGAGSPDPAIAVDHFSVRWTGQVVPRYSETYTFYITSDDGARVWVNGQPLVNNWIIQGPTEKSGTITLTAGQRYDIKVEFFEDHSGATASLKWSSPSQVKEVIPQSQLYPPTSNGTGTGLQAQYFDNPDFTPLRTVQTDPQVNFAWGYERPVSTVSPDSFSVRWSGQVQPRYSETYTFYTDSDDGTRLWVNGQPVINNWRRGQSSASGTITLTAGQKYDLWLEYYDDINNAYITLSWSSPSQAREVVPVSQLYPTAGVNQPPSVAITAPVSGSAYRQPATVTISATASDADGAITKVEFYREANGSTVKIGEDITAPYSITATGLTEPGDIDGYQIIARAIDNSGARTDSTPAAVHVYDVKPGPGYFLIGVWAQPTRAPELLPDGTYHVVTMQLWKDRGINTMVGYDCGPQRNVSVEEWTAAVQATGLRAIRVPDTADGPTICGNTNQNPHDIARLQADLAAAGTTLLAWMHPDEPDYHNIPPSALAPDYQSMKQAAPNHPVWLNFAGPNIGLGAQATYQGYAHTSDWLGFDLYPSNNNRPINAIGDRVDWLRTWSAGKPVFAYIESSAQHLKSGGTPIGDAPTPDEMRAEIWHAVIHGATGILYFPQRINDGFRYDGMTNENPELIPEMKTQNQRLTTWSAMLLAPGGQVAESAPFEAATRSYNGYTYKIVLNLSNAPATYSTGEVYKPYDVVLYRNGTRITF